MNDATADNQKQGTKEIRSSFDLVLIVKEDVTEAEAANLMTKCVQWLNDKLEREDDMLSAFNKAAAGTCAEESQTADEVLFN